MDKRCHWLQTLSGQTKDYKNDAEIIFDTVFHGKNKSLGSAVNENDGNKNECLFKYQWTEDSISLSKKTIDPSVPTPFMTFYNPW